MVENSGWHLDTSPFHRGEQDFQTDVGVRDRIEAFGRKIIRPYITDEQQSFFREMPFIVVGAEDGDGLLWASILFGKPGFLSITDPENLTIDAVAGKGDPIGSALREDKPVGLLGIDLMKRQRNRLNGRLKQVNDQRMVIAVDQTFGNCPQYIQAREYDLDFDRADNAARPANAHFDTLDERAIALIQSADTFYVASMSGTDSKDPTCGVDVSHRGGRAGFVDVKDDVLVVPDFSGNFHFNTLGNFRVNPKAGLTFVDYETGDMLLLTGEAKLVCQDDPRVRAFKGAERAWSFKLKSGVWVNAGAPKAWDFKDSSPNSLITGTWAEADAILAAEVRAQEWRSFNVTRVEDESNVIRSLYLDPDDGDGIVPTLAGQYLTFCLPGEEGEHVFRTYTVSSGPADPWYRVSVKRQEGPGSQYLNGKVKKGDKLLVRPPQGNFIIDASDTRPALLIAAGVGITPMMAMARHVAREGFRTRNTRPLTVLHAARSIEDRAFADDFRQLEEATNGEIRYYSFLDQIENDNEQDIQGPLSREWLRNALGLDDYDVFLCGPAGFMQIMYDTMRSLGIADQRIFAEAFGPASLKRDQTLEKSQPKHEGEPAEEADVRFSIAGIDVHWTSGDGTLLEFAEKNGLEPSFGCRFGACGSCLTKLKNGEIAYKSEPSAQTAEGEIFLCCAVPAKGSDRVEIEL